MTEARVGQQRYTTTELLERAVIGYHREEDGLWVPGLQQQALDNAKSIASLERRMDRRAYIDSLCLRYAGGIMFLMVLIIAYKLTFTDVTHFIH